MQHAKLLERAVMPKNRVRSSSVSEHILEVVATAARQIHMYAQYLNILKIKIFNP